MAGRYQLVSEDREGPHLYQCFDVVDDEELIDEIARLVLELYVDLDDTRDSLSRAAADLDTVVSPAELAKLLDEIRDAVIPQIDPDSKIKLHLQTPRNELAEVLAYDALKQVHDAVIPASRIREKEVPGQPTRGLDIFGLLMAPQIRAIICEVKASSSDESPPGVVNSGGDSMHGQIKGRIGDKAKLLQELQWSLKHAHDDAAKLQVASAMLVLSKDDAQPPVVVPVLVRPVSKYNEKDFGCFRAEPDEYSPAEIRFLILRIPGTIEEFADRIYKRAQVIA